ncbi:hypothetical protein GGF32_004653 [Allomyces javanicus]|nr:hypothetical protein GGF32_004653 [Allomyces javanicus]
MVPPHATTPCTPGGPATAPSQVVTPPAQITPARPATAPDAPRKTPMLTPSAPAAKRQRTEKGYAVPTAAVAAAAAAAARATVARTAEADASPTPAVPVAHGMTTRKRAREMTADMETAVAEAVAQLDVQEKAPSSGTHQQQTVQTVQTVPERVPVATQEQPQAMIAPAADDPEVVAMPPRMPSGPEYWPPEIRDLVAAHVRAADPTTLLRLARITPVWQRSCVAAAIRYATEFLDIVASGYAKIYDTNVYVMMRPRAFSTCPRIVHREKLLTIALPGDAAMANDMNGRLLLSEARAKFDDRPGQWWIPQSETIPVPLAALRRIAFKGDKAFEAHQLPRELLAFRALTGKRAHLCVPKWEALFAAVPWTNLQHLDLDFEGVQTLEPAIQYLSQITNVTVLALTFMHKDHDELKAQMLAAIPRDKIEYLKLHLNVSPTAAAGLLDRPFPKLKVMRTNQHLAKYAPFLDWLPPTLEDLDLWIPTITPDTAENLSSLQTRLVNLKRLRIGQRIGNTVQHFTTPLTIDTVTKESKAPQLLSQLPRSLIKLELKLNLGQTNAIAAFSLPPGLQMMIVHPIANPLVAMALAQHLPATLQRMQLTHHITSGVMVELARHMPPRLKSLSLTGSLGARGWVALAPSLPSTLMHFDMTWTEFETDSDHATRQAPEDADAEPLYHAVSTRLRKLEHVGLREFDRGFTDRGMAAIVHVLPPSVRSVVTDISRVEWVREHQKDRKGPRCDFVRMQLMDMRNVKAPHLFPLLKQATDERIDAVCKLHGWKVEDAQVSVSAEAEAWWEEMEEAGPAGLSA